MTYRSEKNQDGEREILARISHARNRLRLAKTQENQDHWKDQLAALDDELHEFRLACALGSLEESTAAQQGTCCTTLGD